MALLASSPPKQSESKEYTWRNLFGLTGDFLTGVATPVKWKDGVNNDLCSCCGATFYEGKELAGVRRGHGSADIEQNWTLRANNRGNSTYTGDTNRIYMSLGLTKEELLEAAYSEGYKAENDVDGIQLEDKDVGVASISWVNT